LIPLRDKGCGGFVANAGNVVGVLWMKSEEMGDEVMGSGMRSGLDVWAGE